MSHGIHETCDSVTFLDILVHENSNFVMFTGSVFYQISSLIILGEMPFVLMSEKEFVNEVK